MSLDVDLPDRPSPAIETIAYFTAAELLANVAKHSRAPAGGPSLVAGAARRLRLTVRDDGIGGARPAPAGGLAGLAHRVGTRRRPLELSSPPGGPTVVTVELPVTGLSGWNRCGSSSRRTRRCCATVSCTCWSGAATRRSPRWPTPTALLAAVAEHRPDVAVVDVRMPPTHTDEGLRAALALRRDHPDVAVLRALAVHRDPLRHPAAVRRAATASATCSRTGWPTSATSSTRSDRVAGGATVLDPEVVTQILGASRRVFAPGDDSPRASGRCWG